MGNLSPNYLHAPGAATPAVLTLTNDLVSPYNGYAIREIEWSYSAAPTGGSLTVEAPAGVVCKKLYITAAGPGFIPFPSGLTGPMVITLSSGGGGISGTVEVTAG